MSSVVASLLQSVLLPLGGYMGYKKKGSVASLVAGVITGAIPAISLFVFLNDAQNKTANRINACSTLLLTVVMGIRYFRSRKPAPLLVSTLGALCFVFAFAPNSV